MPKLTPVWYIVLALALYIVFLKSCSKTSCPPPQVITTHDTVRIKSVQTVHDRPISNGKRAIDTEYVFTITDTLAIIKDYMSRRSYSDTVYNKYGYALIVDTIYQNKISDRRVTFDFDVPQITLTNTVKPRNQVYGGLILGGSKDFISFGPQLILRTKANNIYNFSASYTTQSSLYYQIGAAWLIKF